MFSHPRENCKIGRFRLVYGHLCTSIQFYDWKFRKTFSGFTFEHYDTALWRTNNSSFQGNTVKLYSSHYSFAGFNLMRSFEWSHETKSHRKDMNQIYGKIKVTFPSLLFRFRSSVRSLLPKLKLLKSSCFWSLKFGKMRYYSQKWVTS